RLTSPATNAKVTTSMRPCTVSESGPRTQAATSRVESPLTNCAEPGMAALKRHGDVPQERVLERALHLGCYPQTTKRGPKRGPRPGKPIRPSQPTYDRPFPYAARGRTSCSSTSTHPAYRR